MTSEKFAQHVTQYIKLGLSSRCGWSQGSFGFVAQNRCGPYQRKTINDENRLAERRARPLR